MDALTIVHRTMDTISSMQAVGFKVFVSEQEHYMQANEERLKPLLFNNTFDIPFKNVAFIPNAHSNVCITREPMGCTNKSFVGYIRANVLGYMLVGMIKIHNDKLQNYAPYNWFMASKDKTPFRCSNMGDVAKYPTIFSYSPSNGGNSVGAFILRHNITPYDTKYFCIEMDFNTIMTPPIEHTYINGVLVGKFIWELISDAVAFFYELIGCEYIVKVIDMDKPTTAKKEKKRGRPKASSLFTILRNPKVTIPIYIGNGERKLGTGEPRGPLEFGYERKEHSRTYKHPRYVNMRGKTVIIASTHVGPDKIKEKLYKVAKRRAL